MALTEEEKLQAEAVSYLIEGGEVEEAAILLSCKLSIKRIRLNVHDDLDFGLISAKEDIAIVLLGTRKICEIVNNDEHPSTKAIRKAIDIVLSIDFSCVDLSAIPDFPKFGPDWRSQLIDAIKNRPALNQGIKINEAQIYEWESLRFRSPVEVIMAKTLDKYNVLFLPNCMARLGQPGNRTRREADFLVCFDGKVGILEIDGEVYHTSAAKDHDRDRLFRHHGIKVCEHYDAKRCLKEPEEVVRDFLKILRQNG